MDPIQGRRFENEFNLQWHITNKCNNSCKHCYINKKSSNLDELSLSESFKVIDDLVQFSELINLIPSISFTGGDPLLKKDINNLLAYANQNKVKIVMLGNASLLNKKNLEMLKKNNVSKYQLSFDGLKDTHDFIRGKGSFDENLEGIIKLRSHDIPVMIMSTVSKINYLDIPELIEFLVPRDILVFDFARLVPIGQGKRIKEECFKPFEYKTFLLQVYSVYKKLKNQGFDINTFGFKDPLWSLFFYELNKENPSFLNQIPQDKKIYGGCSIGRNGFCMEPDGTLYACRRLSEPIGNIKETSIRNFFISSEEMNKYREIHKIKACSDCEIISLCRGCRAVAWSENKNYFERDPQCWK